MPAGSIMEWLANLTAAAHPTFSFYCEISYIFRIDKCFSPHCQVRAAVPFLLYALMIRLNGKAPTYRVYRGGRHIAAAAAAAADEGLEQRGGGVRQVLDSTDICWPGDLRCCHAMCAVSVTIQQQCRRFND